MDIKYNMFIAGFGRDLEPKEEEKKPVIIGRNKFVSYCVSNANTGSYRKLFNKYLTNKNA